MYTWYIMYVQEGLEVTYISLAVNVLVAIISGVCLIISNKVKGSGDGNIHNKLEKIKDENTEKHQDLSKEHQDLSKENQLMHKDIEMQKNR